MAKEAAPRSSNYGRAVVTKGGYIMASDNSYLLANDDVIKQHEKVFVERDGGVPRCDALLWRCCLRKREIDAVQVDKAAIGARIKRVRVELLALTQKQMAELLNTTESTYAGWEQGNTQANDLGILCRIALIGGVTVDYLLMGRDYLTAAVRNWVNDLHMPYQLLLCDPRDRAQESDKAAVALYESLRFKPLKLKKG